MRNVHGVLTKALSQAVKLGYIARNPCDMVDLPRVEKTEIVPLTDAQVKAYLAATASDSDYGDMLKVVLFTGLREAEALGLTWDCVDFDRGTLKICKQLQKRPAEAGGFQFASLKNDRTRILHPAPFVMDILRTVRKSRQRADCWPEAHGRTGRMQPNSTRPAGWCSPMHWGTTSTRIDSMTITKNCKSSRRSECPRSRFASYLRCSFPPEWR